MNGQAGFQGFLLHIIKTTDKVLKYGETSQIKYTDYPQVVGRGSERRINFYVV